MGNVDVELIDVKGMSESELQKFGKENGISLKINEYKMLPDILGRNPTITELHIFNTQWSEHSSYKSSKEVLKMLPTSGSRVILGPKEDAGIAFWHEHNNERYGIVMSHESHNHPSQVVPFEGAATGIGGNVRDVLCMGAHVFACGDPLRFGDPNGKNANRTKYIANGVIDGIAGYGNPLGIPVITGDVYFNESFDDNCLCNVITLGILKEKDIVHSFAPKNAEGYDIIVIGKGTDNSGFGGAAFASLILDEEDKDFNKGAVQVPDPFLKNILIRATEKVFKVSREKGITLGFKDMGAGGIMCATTELCSEAGYGCELDVDKIHVGMTNLPPFIIMCSETQERFTWISPSEFTDEILKIYNEDFELPMISKGARASCIGKVTKEQDYILKHKGKVICNANICEITGGIKYERERKQVEGHHENLNEPVLGEPDFKEAILKVLNHPNVASKAMAYNHYDVEVQGNAVLRPGEGDAGVVQPIPDCKAGVALAADNNPRYTRIDPEKGAILGVMEAMRNVASVGGYPIALTDCLNYGNPEKEGSFFQFYVGVKGISEAAKKLCLYKTEEAVPYISGNVSFYNESKKGKSVDPSPIIGCLGKVEDVSKVISMKIKNEGNTLYLLGKRKDEMGGSVYYDIHKELGKNIPEVDYEREKKMIWGVVEAINSRLFESCHDISDGGMVSCVSEMILGGEADGEIGARIGTKISDLDKVKCLFSESTGFVFEVKEENKEEVEKMFKDLELFELGVTGGDKLVIDETFEILIEELKNSWTTGFVDALK